MHPVLRPRWIFSPRLPLKVFLQILHSLLILFDLGWIDDGGGILLGGSALILHLSLTTDFGSSHSVNLSKLLELSFKSLLCSLGKSS